MSTTAARVAFYHSKARTGPDADLSLGDVIACIRQDPDLAAQVAAIRAEPDKKKRNALKGALPAIQLSAAEATNGRKVQRHSGIVQIDIDGIGSEEAARIRDKAEYDHHIAAAFMSPSGDGVKLAVAIPDDLTRHAAGWQVAADHVRKSYGCEPDPATKDPARLCFFSHDPEAWAKDAEPLSIPGTAEIPSAPEMPRSSAPVASHDDTWTAAEVAELLSYIPPRPKYAEWLRIASAVWSVLPMAEGAQVLHQWSPEEKDGEYCAKHKSRLRQVGIGTLFYLARENGFEPGKPLRAKVAAAVKSGGLFVDLGPFLDGTAAQELPTVAPIADGKALFYRGRLNSIFSEPGIGKSNVLAVAIGGEATAGKRVLVLDPEDSAAGFVTRLRLFGIDPEAIRQHVTYCHNPTPDDILAAQEWARDARPALVILDGCAESMVSAGFDEDKAADVLAFFREWLRPFAEDAGAAVVLADHVVKSADGNRRFARGSGAKLGRIDGAAYSLELGRAYSPKAEGFVRLKIAKDRNGGCGPTGQVAAELHFAPHPATDGTLAEWKIPTSDTATGEPWKPTAIMEKVVAHLRLYDRDSKRGICQAVKSKTSVVLRAIECLAEEGKIVIETSGKSHVIRLSKEGEKP